MEERMLHSLDSWLFDARLGFQNISNFVQKNFGKTCFWLAKWCLILYMGSFTIRVIFVVIENDIGFLVKTLLISFLIPLLIFFTFIIKYIGRKGGRKDFWKKGREDGDESQKNQSIPNENLYRLHLSGSFCVISDW